MTLLYPGAAWKPVSSHGGPMREQRGAVEHITTNDFSPYGFFSRNQASSHLWFAADGTVEQYVDLLMRSWAQGGGNASWTSIEVSGKPGTLKTPAQCEALAEYLAWASQQPELKTQLAATDNPTGRGVGWHGMGGRSWGGHVSCPGSQRVSQTRSLVIPRALQLVLPDQEEPTVYIVKDPNGSKQYATDLVTRRHIASAGELAELAKLPGVVRVELSAGALDAIPEVKA